MQVKDLMTGRVISAAPGESAASAARLLGRYNIGALPVCAPGGRLVGVITDRDIAVRCVAAGRNPATTPVGDLMTARVISAAPEESSDDAAARMSREQIRRMPVVDGGRVVGIVALADLAAANRMEAAEALSGISANVRRR